MTNLQSIPEEYRQFYKPDNGPIYDEISEDIIENEWRKHLDLDDIRFIIHFDNKWIKITTKDIKRYSKLKQEGVNKFLKYNEMRQDKFAVRVLSYFGI
jgi:hypothetical protein